MNSDFTMYMVKKMIRDDKGLESSSNLQKRTAKFISVRKSVQDQHTMHAFTCIQFLYEHACLVGFYLLVIPQIE